MPVGIMSEIWEEERTDSAGTENLYRSQRSQTVPAGLFAWRGERCVAGGPAVHPGKTPCAVAVMSPHRQTAPCPESARDTSIATARFDVAVAVSVGRVCASAETFDFCYWSYTWLY